MSAEQQRPAQAMDPATTYRHRVSADKLVSGITPSSDVFVLAHFGVARIEKRAWRLQISGMVDRPTTLAYEDMLGFAKVEIQSFINCAGFPDNPKIATRNASIRAFGLDVVMALCEKLLAAGAPGLHFYTLNQAALTSEIWQRLGLSLRDG